MFRALRFDLGFWDLASFFLGLGFRDLGNGFGIWLRVLGLMLWNLA